MCRFSTSAPPRQAGGEEGFDALLAVDDGFSWFDAIDDLPEDEFLPAPGEALAAGLAARDSDSSAAGGDPAAGAPAGDDKPSASGGFSDASSYDLVQLFQAQVAARAPAAPAAAAPQYGAFAPFDPAAAAAAAAAAMEATAAAALAEQAMCSGAMPAYVCGGAPAGGMLAPAPAAACLPAHAFACGLPAGMAAAPPAAPSTGSAAVRRPRGQRSAAEVEAAVERIKQKRRESAHRSRQRKNEYMRQLELENAGLKDEVSRLQAMLATLQHGACALAAAPAAMVIGM
ncbi:hypothetical protein HT031_005397 [Scenedesmus sp. PABB004]|nr:hypothetical protein HT031_005397 [Scenedesmus sp. PABB004]